MIKILSTIKYAMLAILLQASAAYAASSPSDVHLFGGSNTKGQATPTTIAEIACIVTKLALDFIPYLVIIAVGAFLMGLVKYVSHGDDEEKRSEGVKMMIYGTLGFFFMVSVWGIMRLAGAGLGFAVVVPQFKSAGVAPFTCS